MIEQIKSMVNEELNAKTIDFLQRNEKTMSALAEKYQMEVTFSEGTLTINFSTAEGILITSYGIYNAVGEIDDKRKRPLSSSCL